MPGGSRWVMSHNYHLSSGLLPRHKASDHRAEHFGGLAGLQTPQMLYLADIDSNPSTGPSYPKPMCWDKTKHPTGQQSCRHLADDHCPVYSRHPHATSHIEIVHGPRIVHGAGQEVVTSTRRKIGHVAMGKMGYQFGSAISWKHRFIWERWGWNQQKMGR